MMEQEEEDEEAGISIKNLLEGKEYTAPPQIRRSMQTIHI
jgi:hypothetical protein